MSDTDLTAVMPRYMNLAIVDEAWVKDSLSDDDIDLPKDVLLEDLNDDDDDDDDELGGTDTHSRSNAHEVWGDLGLDDFILDLAQLNAAQADPVGLLSGSGGGGGAADNGSSQETAQASTPQ